MTTIPTSDQDPAIAGLAVGPEPIVPVRRQGLAARLARNWSVLIGGLMVVLIALTGVCAPLLTSADPAAINPASRNKLPGFETTERDDDGNKITRKAVMGTDSLGRDVYARVVYGARVSLVVGVAVAALSVALGLAIGMVAGYFRWIDAVVMRIMDGLMAIPGILLALGLVAVSGASLVTVILAITVPEIPRVVRLVRGLVLTLREQPYVEAAVASGTRFVPILWRHILPNTLAPIIVQATYVCASAMITEAILSFIGAGTPPNIPSWGNIMAEARSLFQVAGYLVFFPGLFLAITVLSVNLLGDGMRDALDPRLARRM